MKIKITERMVITAHGLFDGGAELTDDKYPKEFLYHLVNEAKCAVIVDAAQKQEVKPVIVEETIEKKSKKTKKHGSLSRRDQV